MEALAAYAAVLIAVSTSNVASLRSLGGLVWTRALIELEID